MSATRVLSVRRDGLLVLAACVLLPLVGAAAAGRALAPLFRFPPPLAIPDYPRFSWYAAALGLGIVVAIAWPWIRRWRAMPATCAARTADAPHRAFPLWGWWALAWIALWWWLAWTRQPWFAWGQRYTFTPLWLGFVVAVNALTWRRAGTCLLVCAPQRLAVLFAGSAAFWWLFEWLNRFVRNWHYPGAEDVGAVEYAVHASVCFSTVLPAVASVREWLGTWPRLQARLARGPAWSLVDAGPVARGMVAAGAGGLLLTGAWPEFFYPALWAAPLLLATGLAVLRGWRGWWSEIVTGDWHEAGAWALAALGCGFWWELWNSHSLAQWIYTVPFVQRWHVFEMPALGYAGYLPFGLECALAVFWLETAIGRVARNSP